MARDRIALEGLRVDCIIGVYPLERENPQPVVLDLELEVDTQRAAHDERLSSTVDYGFVAAQLTFLMVQGRFRLLETAAHVLARHLLAAPAPGEERVAIDGLRLQLRKPEALAGVALPSVTIERQASWARLLRKDTEFGVVELIHQTQAVELRRVSIAPGAGVELEGAQMTLGEGALALGQTLMAGAVLERVGVVRYENPTERWQPLLVVTGSRF
ncbi:dihydroneopterin aldolase [Pseudenhygromyxa sp. WMMC2535]|uniref:dihydroneopterin aldolase n=1 Tax=Pseudenhygromyxa sp. WMMC2535 TaxID=2712867 RepID=UPI0015519456|nr:dihydroneopterin aldolase [Pseudenhygromyxa sp. WMMC2535]NVB38446.1 dihydroneopterin aldolase [Pseudenhygromyxa sp. WMMC2535]